ncbi:MAG TPA: CpXC domain-containing protein, partial [Ardenticatenaceae bacterium]
MAYPTFQRTMRCPQCDNTLTVSLQPVVDVGEDPKQRQRFLKGELNVVRCPRCGFAGSPATPMVYHDPARQLMLAYVPHELGLTLPQEEQEIGRLTNLVLENTPTAQRKAYLLNPTRVMTMDGLYEKVLEAEGVSAEEIRKQTAKIQLVTQMAKAVGDDAALTALIEAHREEIDYNFLVLVTMT